MKSWKRDQHLSLSLYSCLELKDSVESNIMIFKFKCKLIKLPFISELLNLSYICIYIYISFPPPWSNFALVADGFNKYFTEGNLFRKVPFIGHIAFTKVGAARRMQVIYITMQILLALQLLKRLWKCHWMVIHGKTIITELDK